MPLCYRNELIQELKGKPKSIVASGKYGMVVEVGNKHQSELIQNLQSIQSRECTVKDHEFFNVTKGIIYIYNSDINGL